ASCATEESRRPPSCPVPAPGAMSGLQTPTPAGTPPAASWRALLVAGDRATPAFDNGVNTLRERLAERGVTDIRVLSATTGSPGNLASPGNLPRALQGSPP